jgi:hypothetical protein
MARNASGELVLTQQHVARLRAQRQADAKFAYALADGISHNAINSHRAQRHGDHGKHREQAGAKACQTLVMGRLRSMA